MKPTAEHKSVEVEQAQLDERLEEVLEQLYNWHGGQPKFDGDFCPMDDPTSDMEELKYLCDTAGIKHRLIGDDEPMIRYDKNQAVIQEFLKRKATKLIGKNQDAKEDTTSLKRKRENQEGQRLQTEGVTQNGDGAVTVLFENELRALLPKGVISRRDNEDPEKSRFAQILQQSEKVVLFIWHENDNCDGGDCAKLYDDYNNEFNGELKTLMKKYEMDIEWDRLDGCSLIVSKKPVSLKRKCDNQEGQRLQKKAKKAKKWATVLERATAAKLRFGVTQNGDGAVTKWKILTPDDKEDFGNILTNWDDIYSHTKIVQSAKTIEGWPTLSQLSRDVQMKLERKKEDEASVKATTLIVGKKKDGDTRVEKKSMEEIAKMAAVRASEFRRNVEEDFATQCCQAFMY